MLEIRVFLSILLFLFVPSYFGTGRNLKNGSTLGFSISWREDITRTFVSLTPRSPEEFYGDNHYCAGVVISETHVLTTANCVMHNDRIIYRERNLLCVAGWPRRLLYSYHMIERVRALRIIVHPLWIMQDTNDIAIIQLERPLGCENFSINIATLPTEPFNFQTDVDCQLLGWGRRYKDGPLAGEIKVINLRIPANNACPHIDENFRPDDELCAIDADFNLMAPCAGDMGAPLFCNNVLYGVATMTEHCVKENATSTFTDVSRHLNFINTVLSVEKSSCIQSSILLVCLGIVINICLLKLSK